MSTAARKVVRAIGGERATYIETKPADWAEALDAWRKAPTEAPCPMPAGHLMFGRSKWAAETYERVA